MKLIRALPRHASERPSCGEVLGRGRLVAFLLVNVRTAVSVAGIKHRPMQSQKLKIPKNLTGDVGKNIKTIDHDFTGEDNNNSNSSSSIGGQSSGRSSFERSSGENLGRHSTISGKKLNAGLLTAENLALLEKRAMKSPKSKKHFSMDEIEERL